MEPVFSMPFLIRCRPFSETPLSVQMQFIFSAIERTCQGFTKRLLSVIDCLMQQSG